mgnify:FL=1
MADDINNNEGMGEAGDAGMPGDLKRLLARAEQGEDGDPDAITPMPMMTRKRTTTVSSRRALAKSIVAPRPARISTAASSRFRSLAAR